MFYSFSSSKNTVKQILRNPPPLSEHRKNSDVIQHHGSFWQSVKGKALFFRRLRKIGRISLLSVAVPVFMMLFVNDIYSMMKGAPFSNYVFGGTMVNYSAGFVRRGLYGELIHALNAIWQPFLMETLLEAVFLGAILCLFLSRMIRLDMRLPYILAIMFSPSLILLHRREEFFRADVIVLVLNLVVSCFLLHLTTNRKDNVSVSGSGISFCRMLWTDLAVFTVLAVSALIHELSFLLLPPVMLLFFIYARKVHRTAHCLALLDLLFVIYLVMMTRFKFSDPDIIAESWSGVFGNPDSFIKNGGLQNVVDQGSALSIADDAVNHLLNYPLRLILHFFVAVAVPVIIILMSGITVFHSSSSRARNIRRLLMVFCLCPLGLSLTAIDYGRWFSLCGINLVAYALLMAHPAGRAASGRNLSQTVMVCLSTARQCVALIVFVALSNYKLYWDGFLYRNPVTLFEETRQATAILPDFISGLKSLASRDLVIKPTNP